MNDRTDTTTTHCRHCAAEIRLVTGRKRRRMPINPTPHPNGTIVVPDLGPAERLRGEDLAWARSAEDPLYVHHHDTCPARRR